MKTTDKLIGIALSLFFITACSASPKTALQSMPQDYRILLSQRCYCPEQFLGPFDIEVRKGQALSIVRISDQARLSNTTLGKEIPSLEQILQHIQTAQTRHQHRFEVQWVHEPYIPRYVLIDRSARVSDDEIEYRIEGFELR